MAIRLASTCRCEPGAQVLDSYKHLPLFATT
jgi:hypothetical protein